MNELTEFLRARIDEDEADAREHQSSQEWVQEAAGWWDCDRVIAECDVKRRIVEGHRMDSHWCPMGDDLFKVLAAPYADHADYREDWRLT